MIGVQPGLKLQVSNELDVLVEGDVDHAVHVVEAGPVLVEVKRSGSHVPPVKLEEDPVGQAAALVLVPVDRDNAGQILVFHGHAVAGLLAVEARLEGKESSVPASQVGDAGD